MASHKKLQVSDYFAFVCGCMVFQVAVGGKWELRGGLNGPIEAAFAVWRMIKSAAPAPLALARGRLATKLVLPMDEITIKTPNHKCRLYWCFIEFIDSRYSQSWWHFRLRLWNIAPLTFSLTHLPSFPVWISTGLCTYTVCKWGEGIGLCGDYIQELYTVYLTRFSNLQNCLTTPNKNLGEKGASDR